MKTLKEFLSNISSLESLGLPASVEHKQRTMLYKKLEQSPNRLGCLGTVSEICEGCSCDNYKECFDYMNANIDYCIVIDEEFISEYHSIGVDWISWAEACGEKVEGAIAIEFEGEL